MDQWTEKTATFKSFDGTELFYRTWSFVAPSDKAIIFLHRGHEHSGRLSRLVEALDLQDFQAFGFDLRGHGHSPGARGWAESYEVWVKDLNAFARHVSQQYAIPYENITLVANSVGAVTACTWVHDYAPRIRSMVLAAPAFRIKLYIPLAILFLRLLLKIKPRSSVKSYVKARMLTHDEAEAQRYNEDQLITRNIAVNILLGLHDTATRILDDCAAIHTPVLILSAGSDHVVKLSPQKLFYDRITSPHKEMIVYPDFYHALFYEAACQKPIAAARQFILKSFAGEVNRSFLLESDTKGFTKEEYDALLKQPSPLRAFGYALQKAGMKTFGRLSKGIRIGFETGFDSGQSLDHVYANKACGTTPIGKIVDRMYLNAIGWRGIRARKVNLKACIAQAIEQTRVQDRPLGVLDIAAGVGRYLFEVANDLAEKNVSWLLNDNDQRNLDKARDLAKTLLVENVSFVCRDAFDREALASLKPRPHVVIASGLYELFPGNTMVLNSLRGIADVLHDKGYLVYTCQPWHPQVEMIARTLTNRVGEPWIMRRRSQAEMDELVSHAGFDKVDTRVGPYGIFSVSIAQKRSIQ